MSNAARIHSLTSEIRANVLAVGEETKARIAGDAFDIGFVNDVIAAMAANLIRVADALDALADESERT